MEEALPRTAGDLLDAGYPEPLVALLPHLRAVTDAAKEREDERAASLCLQLGECLCMTGADIEAHLYLERALAIYEKGLGEKHPYTKLIIWQNLTTLDTQQRETSIGFFRRLFTRKRR